MTLNSMLRSFVLITLFALLIGSVAALTQENRTNSNFTRSGSNDQPDLTNVGRDLGIDVVEVQVNDVEVETGDTISLAADRREELEIRIVLQANEANADVEVEASVRGDDTFQVIDSSDVFRVEPDTLYVKTLKLALPPTMDEGTYFLRVAVFDRASAAKIFNYFLTVEPRRHDIIIRDVTFNPSDEVGAGRALIGIVRLTNYGQETEDDIKVTLAIPALGVSVSDYIDELDAEDSISSEELLLRIPVNAITGTYPVIASIDYHSGLKHDSRQFQIKVSGLAAPRPGTAGGEEPMTPAEEAKARTVVTIGPQNQDAARGEGGAIYPITLENQASTSKSYTITVSGGESFATVRISPSNLVVVEPGETKQVFVYAAARDGATLGPHVFNMEIAAGSKVLQQVPLTLNIVEAQTRAPTRMALNLKSGLTALLAILIVAGIIIAVMLFSGKKSDSTQELAGKTYY